MYISDINFSIYSAGYYVYVIQAYKRPDWFIYKKIWGDRLLTPTNECIYYVGISQCLQDRLTDHFVNEKRRPTVFCMFKPHKIVEIIKTDTYECEDLITLKYIKKYGLSNVRGGKWATPYRFNKNLID